MSKLRVAATSADKQAVGFYRVWGPLAALQEDVEQVPVPELRVHTFQGAARRVTGVDAPDADVIILQRPTNWALADAIPFFQRAGVAVVVDLDDDLQRTADKHAQRTVYDPRFNPDENWQHLKRACSYADLVVVSTPALRVYAPHGRVRVCRNLVPASYLDVERADDGRTVGWGGTVLNHPGDLQVTYGGVAAALRATDSRFLVVGDGERVQSLLALDEKPETTGFVPIEDYPYHVARFTVGIAPLEDSAFNQAKSALKLLEYSALGVPWVGSESSSEYCSFAEYCDGYLVADRGRSWRTALRNLLQDGRRRRELSLRNREVVAERFTFEAGSTVFAEAWQEAVDLHRGRRAA